MSKLRMKCNGKQGTCGNFISGEFSSFNELAKAKNWQAVGKGWTCESCRETQEKKREYKKPYFRKEEVIETEQD